MADKFDFLLDWITATFSNFDLNFPLAILDKIFIYVTGNSNEKAKNKIIVPEKYFQKSCGMSINKVLNFSIRVKITIEAANDRVIIIGLFILFSSSDPPIIIGKSGKTHGAKIVSTPAIKDKGNKVKSIIIF